MAAKFALKTKAPFLFVVSVLLVTGGLTGCDQVRSKVAALIAPQSAADELAAVNGLIETGKFKQAFDKASARVESQDVALRGDFAYAAAKASAFQSDAKQALKYLAIAVQSLDISPDEVMQEDAFANMRTNVEFLQVITETNQTNMPSNNKNNESSMNVNSGDTGIKMNSSGTEVRAGDVVIKMSK